jgi:hypothetical protein
VPPAVAARLPASRAIIIVFIVVIFVSVRGEGEVPRCPYVAEGGFPRTSAM